jgi:hypothetical protein
VLRKISTHASRQWGITSDHPRGERGAIYGGAAVGDLVRLITSPDLGPQVVFLGLPIPPLKTGNNLPDQVADIKTQRGA